MRKTWQIRHSHAWVQHYNLVDSDVYTYTTNFSKTLSLIVLKICKISLAILFSLLPLKGHCFSVKDTVHNTSTRCPRCKTKMTHMWQCLIKLWRATQMWSIIVFPTTDSRHHAETMDKDLAREWVLCEPKVV